MSGVNINYFGILPFDPNNLPETKWIWGQGTPRPIGFTASEMINLYWTARTFQVNIIASVFGDAFAALIAGASTGTIAGTVVGLNAAANVLQAGGGNLIGKTKITNVYTEKNRVPPSPKQGRFGQQTPALGNPCSGRSNFQQVASNLQQFNYSVQLTNENPKFGVGQNNKVSEGTICGAGPVHILNNSNSRIEINFSSIIYADGKYWPLINIKMPLITSSLFEITPLGQTTNSITGNVIGGVTFLGNVIRLYSTSPSLFNILFATGDVTIGTGCCDRFYYDGEDTERAQDYCKQGCAENGVS